MEQLRGKMRRSPSATCFWGGFLAASLLTFLGFALIRVWPFGDGTVLIIDSLHQYLPFYTDFHEKLTHFDSLLYSFSAGLGYDFWATWAYYMASPLNFLIALVPTPNVCDFMDLMILLKIGLSSGTFAWYLHKRDHTQRFIPIVFGCMFALGNFMMGYYFNLMWLDSIAMLPLIMYGIECIAARRKGRVYGLALFYALWCNYYIGFMLCIFSCLYLALCLIERRRWSWKETGISCLWFGWYSLLAGGMASVVLLPAYRALTASESMMENNFPKTVKFYTDFVEMIIAHFAAEHPINISDSQVGLNAYCGVIVLFLILCYVLDDGIRLKVRAARLSLLGILMLSFSLNILNYVWHGFHQQNGLPNRFAFLYVCLLLTMCYDAFRDLFRLSSWKIAVAGAVPIAFSFIVIWAGKTDFETYGYWNYLTPMLLMFYLGLVVFLRGTDAPRRAGAAVLGGFMLLEAAAHCIYGTQYNENVTRSIYLEDQASYKRLIGKQEETGFYRSEIDSQRMRNVTMFAGGHSMIMFNSTMQASVTNFCDRLGIEARTNKNGYIGVTKLLNDVFGIRYVLSSGGRAETLYQFEKIDADDNLSIYRNDDALSLGFLVNSDILQWNIEEGDPLEVQNAFVRLATGLGDIYTLDRKIDAVDDEKNGVKIPEGKQVYLYLPDRIESITVDTPEYKKTWSTYTDHLYVINGVGDERMASFTCQLKNSQDYETVLVYTCPDELEKQVRDVLAQNQLENVDAAGSHLRGTIRADKDGILLLTVPWSRNWTIRVDGKKTEAKAVGGTLIGIPVTEGEHTIRMTYMPAGLITGLVLSVLCAALFVLTLIFENKERKKKQTMKLRFSRLAESFKPGIFTLLDEKKEELEAKGTKVWNLSVGTPDFETPQAIIDAVAGAAADPASYRYSLKEMPRLVRAVQDFYERRFGVQLLEDEIMAVYGSQEGMAHIAWALCDPGDVALVPNPGYPIFKIGPQLCGADTWEYPLLEENDYLPKLDDIPAEILNRARFIVVNYPGNPLCKAAPDSFYEELIEFAQEHDLIVVHDNAYADIVFGGREGKSFLSFHGAKEVGVEFYSLSKTFDYTGARMSFLVGNAEIIRKFRTIRSQIDYGIFYPVQYGAIAALALPEEEAKEQSAKYEERMEALCGGLRGIGWNVPDSEGTMFVWAPLPEGYTDSESFCLELAEKAGVICTPGSSFGSLGEGYVRFALVLGPDELKQAVAAIEASGIISKG